MKKICCLLLTAAIATCFATESHAIQFKAKGVWLASFQYGQSGNFTDKGHTGYDPSEDEFESASSWTLWLVKAFPARSTSKSASSSGARAPILRVVAPLAPTE